MFPNALRAGVNQARGFELDMGADLRGEIV
jgi:hypothetical protein